MTIFTRFEFFSLALIASFLPPGVLEYLLLLLFPAVGLHGKLPSLGLSSVAAHLLRLLGGRSANGPVELAENVGFDCCS